MNKLTKLLSVFVIAGALGASVAGVAGCKKNNNGNGHTHDYEYTQITGNDEKHTVHCKNDGHEGGDTLEDHEWGGDNTCDKCGYTKTGGEDTTPTVTSVTVNGEVDEVAVNSTITLTATVAGTNNPAQTVTWESSDTSKATVENGVVTGVAEGTVTIKAISTVDNTKFGEKTLTVKAASQGGGEEDSYDLITSSVDFGAAANELAGASTTANQTVGSGGYVYGGKIEFAEGSRFEPGNSCVNTQKRDIKVTLGGVTNSINLVGKGASGTAGNLILKNSAGTEIGKSLSTGNSAAVSITAENLPAGVYTIVSETSIRLTKIEITEKLEKSEATGISVTASKVDFLKNEEFSASGLTVILNYANGRKDTLSASDYEVEESVDVNTAGKYTVTVKYKDNAAFTDTYDVYVYTIDSITMHKIGYENKKQVTLQQAAVTGGTLSYDYLTVKGTGTVEGRTNTFNLPKAALNIENVSVAEAGEKTVNVSVKTDYTTGGKTLADSYKVLVKEKLPVADNKVEVTVGETGDFKTLTQAVQYLKACGYDAAVNKVVKLQAGTYTEKVWIDMNNVTLVGQGTEIDDTVLTYSLVEGDPDPVNGTLWGLDCATLHVAGTNFKAYNLAIRNDFDYINNSGNYSGTQAAQGLALTLDGDGAVIYKCHLYGNQDTLFMKSGRSYYYQTQIDGNVDFIFGNESALAFFDECKVVAINRTAVEEGQKGKEQNGYVTAAKHDDKTKPDYGYIFNNCEFTDDGKVKDGAMSLGRPWGAKATVAYINCSFSAAYSKLPSTDSGKDHRWHDWNASTKAENADFCEYGSTGAGAITTAVQGGSILTEEQAANYTKANMFGTSNGKQTWTTVFDCDAAYSNLRILAGLDEGEVPVDPTVTIDLKDDTLPNGNCVEQINEKYADVLTWEGTGSFELTKPGNGIKIGTNTVITLKVAGEVSLLAGYELPASDYVITYSEGKATIKFVAATGTYGTYLGGIVIDKDKVPADTVSRTVTIYVGTGEDAVALTPFVVNDGATINEAKIVSCLIGTVYEGQVITGVYASDKTTAYTYEAITEDTSIYITLSAYVLKESVDGAKYEFAVDGTNSNEYFELTDCKANSPYLKLVAGSSVKLKVKANAVITITGIYQGWDGIKINGVNQEKQTSEYTVTYTATEAGEVLIELQNAPEDGSSTPTQAALKTITVTYPAV